MDKTAFEAMKLMKKWAFIYCYFIFSRLSANLCHFLVGLKKCVFFVAFFVIKYGSWSRLVKISRKYFLIEDALIPYFFHEKNMCLQGAFEKVHIWMFWAIFYGYFMYKMIFSAWHTHSHGSANKPLHPNRRYFLYIIQK